jgi:hypothetical protein
LNVIYGSARKRVLRLSQAFPYSATKQARKPQSRNGSQIKRRAPADVEDETSLFFNPANEEYREYIKKYLTYILENYDIDGLQLDYIRYAGAVGTLDYGYDDLTKKLFAEKYGVSESVVDEIGQQLSAHSMWKQWCEFKIEKVTSLVREIRAIVNEKRKDIYLSAAVASDTRLETYSQDVRSWMKEGLLDAIYPMTYGEGIVEGSVDDFTAIAGDNAYDSGCRHLLRLEMQKPQATILHATKQTRAYFEYLSFISHESNIFLKETAYKDSALSPTLKRRGAARAQNVFIVKRVNEAILKTAHGEAKGTVTEKLAVLKENISAENTTAAVSRLSADFRRKELSGSEKRLAKLTKLLRF